jgi:hypothetical protein
MRSGAIASLLFLVAMFGRADGLHPQSRSPALLMAKRHPCQLLRAMQSDCCKKEQRIEVLPTVMLLGDDQELIGWERSCGGGLGGPHRRRSSTVDLYYVQLNVKDRTTLRFDITPGYVVFDKAGREAQSIIRGCSAFRGEASLTE